MRVRVLSSGLGKTTLAHVCARHCGYRPVEINASDDRSGASLQARVLDAVEMQVGCGGSVGEALGWLCGQLVGVAVGRLRGRAWQHSGRSMPPVLPLLRHRIRAFPHWRSRCF